MDQPDDHTLWRPDFVAALRTIASAAARLPYGVPEPVLGGPAAIELYSGGLWPALEVELLTTATRGLQTELMEAGAVVNCVEIRFGVGSDHVRISRQAARSMH